MPAHRVEKLTNFQLNMLKADSSIRELVAQNGKKAAPVNAAFFPAAFA